ncbi:DUF2752 domain-containing protein [Nocardioides sambongensis]|uniref:DUF2752 domain-containing protein n=1 Tax=Nocardioides sambongensis TaxID=2589074 RepID=UPI00112D0C01|nr:DUF2752 domain-containing protein [Nocardioides sambongensis]
MTTAPTPPVAARAAQPRWLRMAPPAMVAGVLGAMTVALHVRDPHSQGSWGLCPSAAVGFWCPGCGGLRAVNDLTDLRILDAASSNLLFVASIPILAYIFYRWAAGRWTDRRWDPSERSTNFSAVALIVLMVLFAVVRNTTAGSWLAP